MNSSLSLTRLNSLSHPVSSIPADPLLIPDEDHVHEAQGSQWHPLSAAPSLLCTPLTRRRVTQSES